MTNQIEEVLTRGVEKIYPNKEELEKLLNQGKKLRIYQGFDPSMPSLHLGNFVGLMKLRQFQKLGHEIIFLIGDFTGMVGDPSGKSDARKPLTREQVLTNAKDYKNQAEKVISFSGDNPAKIKFNSEWLDKITYSELLKLSSLITYAQVIERDMFQKRVNEGKDLFLNELLYPLMQGYDCVAMDVDLEIGGSDQMFNMMMGRTLMKKINGKEKFVLTTKLLLDKDGNKVGKTTGNALFLDSTPKDFYGGIMSFPDEVIETSFELLTECPLEGLKEKVQANPMNEKKRLAFEIVKILWGEEKAISSQKEFENTFQNKETPQDINEVEIGNDDTKILSAMINSKIVTSINQAKTLIKQGAVEINSVLVSYENQPELKDGDIIKIGKKNFIKIKIK